MLSCRVTAWLASCHRKVLLGVVCINISTSCTETDLLYNVVKWAEEVYVHGRLVACAMLWVREAFPRTWEVRLSPAYTLCQKASPVKCHSDQRIAEKHKRPGSID